MKLHYMEFQLSFPQTLKSKLFKYTYIYIYNINKFVNFKFYIYLKNRKYLYYVIKLIHINYYLYKTGEPLA